MPTFSDAMNTLSQEQQSRSDRIEALKENTSAFETELAKETKVWEDATEPVSGKSWIKVEDVAGELWGRRVRLFNGHFVEFVITRKGLLVVRDSEESSKLVDLGFRVRSHGKAENFTLGFTENTGVKTLTLGDVLGEIVLNLGRLSDLTPEREEALKWREPQPLTGVKGALGGLTPETPALTYPDR